MSCLWRLLSIKLLTRIVPISLNYLKKQQPQASPNIVRHNLLSYPTWTPSSHPHSHTRLCLFHSHHAVFSFVTLALKPLLLLFQCQFSRSHTLLHNKHRIGHESLGSLVIISDNINLCLIIGSCRWYCGLWTPFSYFY